MLAGCVSYHPAPVSPTSFVDVQERRAPPGCRPCSTADLLSVALAQAPAVRESSAHYHSMAAAARASRIPPPAALQLTAEYSRDANPDKPWLGAGLLDLPLDLGGSRHARIAAADLVLVQARYDYGEAVWATRSAIAHARIDRLSADQLAPLAARDLALRQDRAAKLEARVHAGEDANSIMLIAQVDIAVAQRRLRDIAARRGAADVALASAIGLDHAAAEGIVLEALPPAVLAPVASEVAGWRREAAAGRLIVLRAIIDYDLAENALRLEIANQYPAIRIQPGYTYERGLVKLPFGLNLLLPPRDLNRAAIAAAEANRSQAGARLETVQAAVLGETDRAAAALDAQLGAERTIATRDVPAATRLVRISSAGLKAGESDRVDDDAAIAGALETDIALLEASRLGWIALADLEDALRRPNDPRETAVLENAMNRLGAGQ